MVANTDQESKLLVVISRANQEAWNEIISIIAQLEEYLEKKHNIDIHKINAGTIFEDPNAGAVLIIDKIRIPANTLDFQVIEFLKKIKILFASLADLNAAIKKLPANAVDVLNDVPSAQAQTHFLLNASERDLKGFIIKTKIETALLRISTDLATIQRDAHTLMELSLGKAVAA